MLKGEVTMNSETEVPRTIKEKFKGRCGALREAIRVEGGTTKHLLRHPVFDEEQTYVGQHSEMKANIMLAYRHLEDARMRIGKILQAAGDGVSILDKKPGEVKTTTQPGGFINTKLMIVIIFVILGCLILLTGCQEEQKVYGQGELTSEWISYFGTDNDARVNFLQQAILYGINTKDAQGKAVHKRGLIERVTALEDKVKKIETARNGNWEEYNRKHDATEE